MQFNFITLAPRNCDCKNNIISFLVAVPFFYIFIHNNNNKLHIFAFFVHFFGHNFSCQNILSLMF